MIFLKQWSLCSTTMDSLYPMLVKKECTNHNTFQISPSPGDRGRVSPYFFSFFLCSSVCKLFLSHNMNGDLIRQSVLTERQEIEKERSVLTSSNFNFAIHAIHAVIHNSKVSSRHNFTFHVRKPREVSLNNSESNHSRYFRQLPMNSYIHLMQQTLWIHLHRMHIHPFTASTTTTIDVTDSDASTLTFFFKKKFTIILLSSKEQLQLWRIDQSLHGYCLALYCTISILS